MDEPWRRWSDISQEDADAESLDMKQPVSIRRVRDTDLERLAKEAGTIAGQAVALVRKVRETAGRREEWKGGISDLRASAKGRLQQLRRSAEEHAEEWRRLAVEKTEDLRRQAQTRYQQARGRAEQVGRDYPLQTVLAAAAAGFVLGIALRLRKAHHAR